MLLREILKSDEPIKHFPEGWVSGALPPILCSRPGLASRMGYGFPELRDFLEIIWSTPTFILSFGKLRLRERKGLTQDHAVSDKCQVRN